MVSSDRPPKDIPTLEDRLRSRFEGGLMADIQPPDFETRLAILTTKLGPYSKLVPDEVCSFIAHRIQKNIRELEGALIRVLAHASINGQQITLETAQQILRDVIPVQDSTPVSIETIQLAVAAHYDISVEEMKGKRRDKNIVFPRQVAMYLDPRGDRVVAPGHRQRLRRTGSHHRAARDREDHRAHARGRSPPG